MTSSGHVSLGELLHDIRQGPSRSVKPVWGVADLLQHSPYFKAFACLPSAQSRVDTDHYRTLRVFTIGLLSGVGDRWPLRCGLLLRRRLGVTRWKAMFVHGDDSRGQPAQTWAGRLGGHLPDRAGASGMFR